MTHRVHPYIFRVGGNKTWKSRWFSLKKFQDYLREDTLLRAHLKKRLRQSHVELIEFERSPNIIQVIIKTSRPGILIGRSGEGAEKLKGEINKYLCRLDHRFKKTPEKREIKLTIEEVRDPDAHASIVARMMADDIEKRLPFRRVLKQAIDKVASVKGVRGVKIVLKGRLGGAEMARYEHMKKGQIPLQTMRADIDYAEETAFTTYGTIGIKVWIYKGEVFENVKSNPQN